MRSIGILSLLLALLLLAIPPAMGAGFGVAIIVAPPPLPVYEQPVCPGDDYIWTPGYWAWDADYDDYYWVPGTWVVAPEVGFFWTPGYWGWAGDRYVFYDGYWGPQVGFYGGIDYGFGYSGEGFEGGRWDHDHFFYNRSVTNVNVTVIHNVYNQNVNNHVSENRVSFNGGHGGINARPSARETAAMHERHIAPVSAQEQQVRAARSDSALRASVNHGRPPVAATPRPGAFTDRAVAPARNVGASYNPPRNRGREASGNAVENNNNMERGSARSAHPIHPNELPPVERTNHPNTGNSRLDQKYQQQQDKLAARQEQDRQKLQRQQDAEHQRFSQQRANDARTQQLEQRHEQQTQQMAQRHAEQQQSMQQKQQAPSDNHSKSHKE